MAKRLYTVKAGDTLSRIARDELQDMSRWSEIAYINSIADPYIIRPGQVILLPVDNGALVIPITGYGGRAPTNGGGEVKQAAFEFTPATIALVGIIAVAVFFFMEQK
jgi:LysM repeat protein